MAELVKLGEQDKADENAKHRVLVTFKNDNGIDGAKFDVDNVTPEQLFVAIAYLNRIANQLIDARQLQAAQQSGELDSVMQMLRRERSGN